MAEENTVIETTEPIEDSGLTKPVQETKKDDKSYHQYLVQLKELLPILSVVLVFLGYWNLDSYYSYFYIDIHNYVSVSDILVSFLPIAKLYMAGLLYIITVITLVIFTIYRFRFSIALAIIIAICVITIIINPFGLDYNIIELIKDSCQTQQYGRLILHSTIFIFMYALLLSKAEEFKNKKPILIVISFTILVFSIIWKKNYEKYQSLSTNSIVTSILIDNKTISTDDNLVYIGQTQNYIFLRKLKEEVNVIYKMSDIDKLEIEGKIIK